MERKLAAIMATDVVGYSKLMAEDEVGTFLALKAHRSSYVHPEITKNAGRVFKLTGDGMFAEFPSAVGAVNAALAIQKAIAAEDDPIRLRIGISLGDVIVDGEDIYGHGVNIAARLEGLAASGGLCVSDVVHQQVSQHLATAFADACEVNVKNIATPIKVWHWPSAPAATEVLRSDLSESSRDRPSIAVLPFDNLSSDAEQIFFCEGIVEEIVSALSKIERLVVMDRISTQAYRGADVDIREVGHDQKVRYILRGSVRRQGDKLRVVAQLSDAQNGETVFSERYNRKIDDIFDIQDEITREIASSLQVRLTDGEQARLWASGTRNLDAWTLCIRAAELIDKHIREDTQEARRLLDEALRIDPSYAVAWCKLGWAHWSDARHHWTSDPLRSLTEAERTARRALEIDPDSAEPYALLAMSAMQAGDFDAASDHIDQAVERATGQSFVLATASMVLALCGRPIDAIDVMLKAMDLCPIYPSWYKVQLGRSYYLAGNFEAAIFELGELFARKPQDVNPVLLVAALHESGRSGEAEQIIQKAADSGSPLSISAWSKSQSFSDPGIVERIVAILNALGVPE